MYVYIYCTEIYLIKFNTLFDYEISKQTRTLTNRIKSFIIYWLQRVDETLQ